MQCAGSPYIGPVRTILWERKPRGSEAGGVAAERIRQRFAPKWHDRLADPLAEFGERLHALWESKTLTSAPRNAPWLYELAPVFAVFALAFGLFVAEGRFAMAPHYFGSIAAAVFGVRAYRDWHSRHPLPEIHLRSSRHDIEALIHGFVAGIAAFVEIRIISLAFEGPALPISLCLLASGMAMALTYQFRAGEPKPPEPRRTALGILAGVAGWAFGTWFSRFPWVL